MEKLKKIFHQAWDLLGKIGDAATRLKTLLILFVVLLVLSGGLNKCQHNKAIKFINKITKFEIENLSLMNNIHLRDSLSLIDKETICMLNDSLDNLQEEYKYLNNKNSVLEYELGVIANEVKEIPPDSSYAILQAEIYPTWQEEKPYPFSADQVERIHITALERLQYISINENLQDMITNLKESDRVREETIELKDNELVRGEETRADLERVIENKDEENELYKKELNKAENKKGFWKITSGVLGVLLIIAII